MNSLEVPVAGIEVALLSPGGGRFCCIIDVVDVLSDLCGECDDRGCFCGVGEPGGISRGGDDMADGEVSSVGKSIVSSVSSVFITDSCTSDDVNIVISCCCCVDVSSGGEDVSVSEDWWCCGGEAGEFPSVSTGVGVDLCGLVDGGRC